MGVLWLALWPKIILDLIMDKQFSAPSARTNNKSKSIEERLLKIKRFYWWTQYQMALEEP
jgi:hypothetical protein